MIIKQIIGICLLVFGGLGLAAAVSASGLHISSGTTAATYFAMALLLSLGLWLMRDVRKQKVNLRMARLDEEFPAIINEKEQITARELAKENRIPRKAAQQFLEKKSSEYPSEVHRDEKGKMVYKFGKTG